MENAIRQEYYNLRIRRAKLEYYIMEYLSQKYRKSCEEVKRITDVIRTYADAMNYGKIIGRLKDSEKNHKYACNETAKALNMSYEEVYAIIKSASIPPV